MVSETNGEKNRLKWALTNIERDEQPGYAAGSGLRRVR